MRFDISCVCVRWFFQLLLPVQTDRRRIVFYCPSVCPSVLLSVCSFVRFVFYQPCEHIMLKTNELILIHIGTSGQGHETFKFWRSGSQRVKAQGHTRQKIDLEAWRRHHSRPCFVEQAYSFFTIMCGIHNFYARVFCYFYMCL